LGFPESYVQQTDRHPMDWIAELIGARGWKTPPHRRRLEAYY